MKDMTWIKTRLIAHRGLHTGDAIVPENSMKAFRLAVENGYGIECDVNVLKDGTVVVFHDINLKRLCGIDLALKDITIAEIGQYRLLGTEEIIPTLHEFLRFIDGRVPLLIELKPLGDNDLLCENFMKTMDGYQGQWAMHSFHPATVYWFRKHHPEVVRGQISEFFKDDPKMNKYVKYAMKHLLFNLITKPDFINYGIYDLPNRYADRAQRHGIVVIAYASRNQADFDMCKQRYSNSVFELFIPKV